ncbi:MAG TPA: metallophosphoesterase [Kiritimatiellia bacterium]|nr:metallophosphoesterase [Kiritimatiellia bacterium]HRU71148.1 metallophosphoesterase [Kiritimatiellia bacterium]
MPVVRRRFLQMAAVAGAATAVRSGHAAVDPQPTAQRLRGGFALDGERIRIFSAAVRKPLKIMVVGDTHLFLDDARGEPYRAYSGRMAKAYNTTKHVVTGAPTTPQDCFEQTLSRAREERVALLVLAGDILSFPSEAAVEWAHARLQASGVPYLYIAGNHDWRYEGMEGTSHALRQTWTMRRLAPLYQGRHPLMAAIEVGGLRAVVIDNSTYEILPEQAAFFREQVASGAPLALFMHIPLYAPGRAVGFGCGHPDWNAAHDKHWQTERRMKWPESGHTPTTLSFRREVFAAPNMLGVFAGHIHTPSLDCVNGIPQIVTAANAAGGCVVAEFFSL